MYPDRAAWLSFYRNHLETRLLPFWHRALDPANGGVFTCFNNEGAELVSRNKYVWSQGRFVWLWSKLAEMCARGSIDGDAAAYLEQAGRTVRMIADRAVLENGHCVYVLDENGEKMEPEPGQGYDTSVFVDGFVVLGMSQYAQTAGDQDTLRLALRIWDSVRLRLSAGDWRSEPFPVPQGLRSQSVPMIMLNATTTLADAAERLDHGRAEEIRGAACQLMSEIMEDFCQGNRLVEMIADAPGWDDTMLCRHATPGHSMESMWFVMTEAEKAGRQDFIRRACEVMKHAYQIGWDRECGGMFRHVDHAGGMPQGRRTGNRYEKLFDTWDMKLWWPHSETLYASLYGWRLTGDEELLDIHEECRAYTFRTFPHPNPEIGEWIQIRDRQGNPVDKVVALPVKDPFHAMRNVLLLIDLLGGKMLQEAH